MPERLNDVVKAEQGNTGAIRVLSAIGAVATASASRSADPTIKAGAAMLSGALNVAVKALQGGLDPDQIDLDQLFVKSPQELLQEKGISQGEIDRILRGD